MRTFRTILTLMNARFRRWTDESIPGDWTRTRDQWEYAHAFRFVLQLAGFAGLLQAALSDRSHDES